MLIDERSLSPYMKVLNASSSSFVGGTFLVFLLSFDFGLIVTTMAKAVADDRFSGQK